jgi:hypothetical protein
MDLRDAGLVRLVGEPPPIGRELASHLHGRGLKDWYGRAIARAWKAPEIPSRRAGFPRDDLRRSSHPDCGPWRRASPAMNLAATSSLRSNGHRCSTRVRITRALATHRRAVCISARCTRATMCI